MTVFVKYRERFTQKRLQHSFNSRHNILEVKYFNDSSRQLARPLLMESIAMEAKMKLFNLVFLVLVTLLLAHCGNSGSGSTAATTYSMSNGLCYSNSGQQVATTYCNSSNGYYLSNGSCYSSSGQAVSTTYCNSTGSGYYLSNGACYNSAGQQVTTTSCYNSGCSNGYCNQGTGNTATAMPPA